jgi:hypothetical protein
VHWGFRLVEVIRRAVRDALPYDDCGPWMRFAGFVESGDPKASQSIPKASHAIDDIVYGAKD